jgi:hypothetical protein
MGTDLKSKLAIPMVLSHKRLVNVVENAGKFRKNDDKKGL